MDTRIVVAGGDRELVSSVESCIRDVSGCKITHHQTLIAARTSLVGPGSTGLLLVYLDGRAGQPAAIELLAFAQSRNPPLPSVVIAESEEDLDCGAFLKAGATACLIRPLNLSRLSFLIDFLTLRVRTFGSIARVDLPDGEPAKVSDPPLISEPAGKPDAARLIFESERSKALLKDIRRLAQVDSSVLFTGETGSGKTCLARLMHDLSPRKNRPFVVVNCGAIPESLLESELFGHGKGAFTGADRTYSGKFSQAEDGTLFLDEIDSLPLASQSRLLRVIEDRVFEAVGSGQSQQVAARLVFATNRDLGEEVNVGRFRMDLYYRVNVVALSVPPLRQRTSAIPVLVESILQGFRDRRMTRVQRFSEEALAMMGGYQWPGNVRELKNVVERIAVLAEKTCIDVDGLPQEITGSRALPASSSEIRFNKFLPADSYSLSTARHVAERQTIIVTLKRCQGNRTKAAEMLGISRAAFYKKLQHLGVANRRGPSVSSGYGKSDDE